MATQIDKEACREAYNDVRDDATETSCYSPKNQPATGTDYEEFKKLCKDDTRLFGFVRFTTGDAMSKRAKFTFLTWIGEDITGLQRAKISTDKTLVKDVVQNFAKEFVISDSRELDQEFLCKELRKAGGANYDAQAE
uniref:Coactosin-like protein n=1 Tax=Nothobranchius furzeri TaxID=105023 RepID=A0A8C6PZI1_NOTFU